MKTMSFFNEKGGVGKSVHTELFAAWLRYKERKRVLVFDFEPEPRLSKTREGELKLLEDPASWLSRYMAKNPGNPSPYDIVNLAEGVKEYSVEYLKRLCDMAWKFVEEHEGDYDYALFDFPALFLQYSPAFMLISSGIVDLTAIPIDADNNTRREGILTGQLIRDNKQNVVAFWNNVSLEDIKRKGYLESGEEIFVKNGIEVLPQRVKSFAKAKRDSDERLFVKSTVCWPERYVEMACPQLVGLYGELKSRLDCI